MKRAVFYISSPVHFKQFKWLSKSLNTKFEFYVILDDSNHELSVTEEYLLKEGIEYLKLKESRKQGKLPLSILDRALIKVFRTDISYIIRMKNSNNRFISSVFNKVSEANRGLFICFEDNYGNVLNAVRSFNLNHWKTAVIPTMISNEEELVFSFGKLPEFQIKTTFKKIFYTVYSKWKRKTKIGSISCALPSDIISMRMNSIAPADPWIPVGGNSSYVLFESKFMCDYYKRNNLPLFKKVKILQQKEVKKKEINSASKKTVVCALPPDHYENAYYSSYDQMVTSWIKTLVSENVKLIVSLHPRTKPESVRFIEDFGAEITDYPVEKVIDQCDIFVACISATIRYALAAEKAILNYDMYNMNYTEYNNIDPVIIVKDPESFSKAYSELVKGEHDESFKEYYKLNKGYFGNCNYANENEVTELITELCQEH